jgi:hypothetical protein
MLNSILLQVKRNLGSSDHLFPSHTKTNAHNASRKRTTTGCQAASMPAGKSGWMARSAGRKKNATKARKTAQSAHPEDA